VDIVARSHRVRNAFLGSIARYYAESRGALEKRARWQNPIAGEHARHYIAARKSLEKRPILRGASRVIIAALRFCWKNGQSAQARSRRRKLFG
jgi:hypothetical protein